MKAFALLLVCAACGGDDVALYPVNPGGGGPAGGSIRGDASEGDGDGGVMISGRVCLINDARNPTTCASTGAAGLTVTLGTRMATTLDDGSFTISVMTGTTNVWRVSGTDIAQSAMAVGGTNTIPALSQAIYTSMITDSGVTIPAGSGSIIAQLTTNNNAAIGANATTAPTAASGVFYDGGTATMWQQDSTGNAGVVWATGIDPTSGSATVTVTTALQTTTQITNVPVFADTITYVFADVP